MWHKEKRDGQRGTHHPQNDESLVPQQFLENLALVDMLGVARSKMIVQSVWDCPLY